MKTMELKELGLIELSSSESMEIEGGNPVFDAARIVAYLIDYFFPAPAGPSGWAGCEEPPY